MPDKKNVKPTIKVGKKESKAEMFLRLAKLRTEKVLKALRVLSNCSNRTNYEYNSEQVSKMYERIITQVENTFSKFTESKTESENFEF